MMVTIYRLRHSNPEKLDDRLAMLDEQQPPQLQLVQKPSTTKNLLICWNQLYHYIKEADNRVINPHNCETKEVRWKEKNLFISLKLICRLK